jgi:hypothetical protein
MDPVDGVEEDALEVAGGIGAESGIDAGHAQSQTADGEQPSLLVRLVAVGSSRDNRGAHVQWLASSASKIINYRDLTANGNLDGETRLRREVG